MNKCVAITAAVLALATMAGKSQAQIITWGSAQDVTGASDVATNGTSIAAVTADAGSNLTVNGITFDTFSGVSGNTVSFNSTSNITFTLNSPDTVYGSTPSGATSYGNWISMPYSNGPSGATSYERAISGNSLFGGYYGINSVDNGGYDSDLAHGNGAINLSGLTVGQEYQVQIWSGSWNNNGRSVTLGTSLAGTNHVTLHLGDSSDGVALAEDEAASGQYVLGTFVATAATQTIYDSSITPSAISLESVPEPSSWTFVLAGLCGLGVVLRARRKMVV